MKPPYQRQTAILRRFLLRKCLFHIGKHRSHDQFFFRAGHRYIKHTQLFAPFLQRVHPREKRAVQCILLRPLFYINRVQSDPEIRVQHHTVGVVPELLPAACQKDHRILQTLALVDCQDRYRILRASRTCLPHILLVFLQPLDVAHKIKQSFIARILISNGQLHQLFDVLPPHITAGQCRNIRKILCLPQNPRQQFIERHPSDLPPPARQLFQKGNSLFIPRFPGELPYGAVKRFLRICRPHPCQLFIGKRKQRRLHHRRERDILRGIVEHPQQRQHGLHFDCRKISGHRYDLRRYSIPFQDLLVIPSDCVRAPVEYRDIRQPHRPQLSRLLVCNFCFPQQLSDARSDHCRFIVVLAVKFARLDFLRIRY